MTLPMRMAAALAIPKETTVASCLATWATALAATIWVLIWPITTALIEVPSPHISSLAITGSEYRMKSPNSSGSRTNRSENRRQTRLWIRGEVFIQRAYPNTRTSSIRRAQAVASAAPAIPMAGRPNRPKMNRALSAMFANKEMRNTTIDTTTRSTLRMMLR